MKKSKELGKKNEGKEYKKEMTKDKAAKIITNEINSRAKLNRANSYLKKKNEIEKIIENKNLPLDYLQEISRKVLKNK